MPRFSIILPTYNRRDTIMRAVNSVLAQSFSDWELLITDDGSTDGTRDILPTDPRIRVFSQPNGGITSARNRGLRERRGELVAFLDSDDEWHPIHLELADAFYRAHPDERLYMGEFVQDWGGGLIVRHFEVELAEWMPQLAKQIGSRALAGPPPQNDPYLRVYTSREPIGAWGQEIATRGKHPGAMHYRGNIFRFWSWYWMMLMQSTVVPSAEVDAIGLLDDKYPLASDFMWMAELTRRHTANLVTVPVVTKYEFAPGGRHLEEEHLAWGNAAPRFFADMLSAFDELFWSREEHTHELAGLRSNWALQLARASLLAGNYRETIRALEAVGPGHGGALGRVLKLLTRAVPQPQLARALFRAWVFASAAPRRVRARVRPSRLVPA